MTEGGGGRIVTITTTFVHFCGNIVCYISGIVSQGVTTALHQVLRDKDLGEIYSGSCPEAFQSSCYLYMASERKYNVDAMLDVITYLKQW